VGLTESFGIDLRMSTHVVLAWQLFVLYIRLTKPV
jgi:hypothetical protein